MQSIPLHRGSVLAGMALAVVFTVLAGAAQSPGTATSIPIQSYRLVGEIPAPWWVSVRLNHYLDGTPSDSFAIPADRYFVVTKFAGDGILVDGIDRSLDIAGAIDGNATRVVLPPGSLLLPRPGNNHFAHLWGYLEPLR